MGGHNVRLTNRKAWQEQRDYVRRLVMNGAPCAICGRSIDLDAPQWITRPDGRRVRSPLSLEVDHVRPLARGGAVFGTVGVVQPSHRVCNVRKGAARGIGSLDAPRAGSTSREW